ncbi:MAG TPA: lipopolysaccharide heptosyltransferase II [Bryobacteraceae bacterium]|nr:lipopolysaccharide heptosyltransferase II [Bryobacteraceae bacterium]
MRIVVRATNWIGDAIMSLPALRALRVRYPDAHIALLAKPWVAALYEGERAVDRIIRLDGASGPRDWRAKAKLARSLRSERFDLAVLFPNSFESAALVFLAGVKRRVGYARDGRGVLLTDAVPVPREGETPRHERFYYLELLRRAGLIGSIPECGEILLDNAQSARTRGEELFASRGLRGGVIGVSPGAAFGGAKRWPQDRFAEAAGELAMRGGASIAVFGSAAERPLCDRVAALCGGKSFAGETTLREFIDMTAACRLFLANDSGAMHIAAALGVPSVTVFGPTDETATGPCGHRARTLREPVECAPCKKRECPIDHRCMTRVDASRVVAAAEELIAIRC